MDNKFQTSFIPKKPSSPGSTSGLSSGAPLKIKPTVTSSIFFNFSVVLFIISLGLAGAFLAWKTVLNNQQDQYKTELADREKKFNRPLIHQLQEVDAKIDMAKKLLDKHIAVSNVFDVLSKITAENVRFMNMETVTPIASQAIATDPISNSGIEIKLSGYGTNLTAVAFQAKVLGQLEKYGLDTIFNNPAISDPQIDTNGAVSFTLKGSVDSSKFIYMGGTSPTNNQ